METLTKVGIYPLLLSWLCSYISEREQQVLVNGEQSQSTRVLSGIPQGSVLDPLLFLIYSNSITKVPLSQRTKIVLYADDMLMYKPICAQSCYVELQQDINSIYQWSQENLMSFNPTKYKNMLLTNK